MSRNFIRTVAAAAALLAAVAASPGHAAAQAPVLGDDNIYVGTYREEIAIIDERTGAVTGSIPLTSGIPRSMVLTQDRKRFYVLNNSQETLEVVDIASRQPLRKFTLSTPYNKVRIFGYNIEPAEQYAVLLTKSYHRLPDRYSVSPPVLLRYDLRTNAVTDTIAWPEGEERDRAQILFSPNGELMYFFAEDILVYDTDTFAEVDRWAYSQALDDGLGRFDFGFNPQSADEPGFYTGLFRFADPVHGRRMMGIARVNLEERDLEFFTLGPDESVSFTMTADGDRAYGIHNEVGNYMFWTFDLEGRRVAQRARFAGRPRMSLGVSSSGEVLYVYNAGNTIDLYDADTYAYISTIDIGSDNTTPLYILPRPDAQAFGGQ